MAIPSIKFMAFLLAVCVIYYLLPLRYRTLLLAVASWCFYGICQPKAIVFLIAGTAVCYGCAIAAEDRWLHRKRLWIAAGTIYFLGVLIYCKYLGFFAGVWFQVVGREMTGVPSVLLPIGISFYTFTALSYLFEVAKGTVTAERNIIYCALYLSFFPSILSGPINRPAQLFPEIREQKEFSFQNIKTGLMRIALGTVRKLVVANNLGLFTDAVYADPASAGRGTVLLAIVAGMLQIYFDFSGYTEIALGSAKLFGFSLPENFKAPFFADSVKDFWRRWHISLTTWFRDYVFFPLGGSRVRPWRAYLNVLLVFALSGFWHGAGWTFILWGLLNGVYQIAETFLEKINKKMNPGGRLFLPKSVSNLVRIIMTFTLISLSSVLFRAENLGHVVQVFHCAFLGSSTAQTDLRTFVELRPLAMAFFTVLLFAADDYYLKRNNSFSWSVLIGRNLLCWLAIAVVILYAAVFGVYGGGYDAGGFVYFQF